MCKKIKILFSKKTNINKNIRKHQINKFNNSKILKIKKNLLIMKIKKYLINHFIIITI